MPVSTEAEQRASAEEPQRTLQEAHVHQLEVQNRELRRAQAELEAIRARYFDLYDLAPVGYCTLDEKSELVQTNLTTATLLGVQRRELEKQTLTRYIVEDDQEIYDRHRNALASGGSHACELRMVRQDGRQLWIHLAATVVKEGDGTTVLRTTLTDVTDRKVLQLRGEHERALLEFVATRRPLAEGLASVLGNYEAAIPGMHASVLLLDANGRLRHGTMPHLPKAYCDAIDGVAIGANTGSCGAAAFTGEAVLVADIAHDPRWLDYRELALAHGLRACWSIPIFGRAGAVLGAFAFYFDAPREARPDELETLERGAHLASLVVERHLAEVALRESERRFRTMVEWTPIATAVHRDGKVLFVNPAALKMYGVPSAESILGKPIFDFIHPEFHRLSQEFVARLTAGGEPEPPGEYRLFTADGTPIDVVAEGTMIVWDGAPAVHVAMRDVTAAKQAEARLHHSEAFSRAILDSMTAEIAVIDRDGTIMAVNEPWRRFGMLNSAQPGIAARNTDVGANYLRICGLSTARDTREATSACAGIRAVLAGEMPSFTMEYPCHSPDEERWFSMTVTPLGSEQGAVITHTNITARKRAEDEKYALERQLQHAMKMQSIGRLAGGVAHDFNNMLGVVLGHTGLAMEELGAAHPVHQDLLEIKRAAERSADLTRQLLAFARNQTIAPRVLDLNETITSLMSMLPRLIGEDVRVSFTAAAELWPVRIDPSQVDQILTNLCVNARDAIDDVGTIAITTANHVGAESPDAPPGEYVKVTVLDDGAGMSAEVLAQIFEPFFTTKPLGTGTGLGLATVHGAVKQNQGFLRVTSEVGRGTAFEIYLPRHVGTTESRRIEAPAPAAQRGGETILVVEDEPGILNITTRQLTSQGYTVLRASGPLEALRLAREHVGELHLLLSDVVMPEMNGRQLAQTLRALFPQLKLLFMSGYTADVIATRGVLDEGVNFIQKPFTRNELATKVREALDVS
jgi:PAS domain S-box-containing protein